jgi:hypothetical protein
VESNGLPAYSVLSTETVRCDKRSLPTRKLLGSKIADFQFPARLVRNNFWGA